MLLNWLRTAVKNTVLAGVSDALDALGIAPHDSDDAAAAAAARLLQARLHAPLMAARLNGHVDQSEPANEAAGTPETAQRGNGNGRGRKKADADTHAAA